MGVGSLCRISQQSLLGNNHPSDSVRSDSKKKTTIPNFTKLIRKQNSMFEKNIRTQIGPHGRQGVGGDTLRIGQLPREADGEEDLVGLQGGAGPPPG